MAAELFRLVWTKATGETVASEPLSRDGALRQFDNCGSIRSAASRGRGRLRVLADAEYQRLHGGQR